jgi:hypothetical protein
VTHKGGNATLMSTAPDMSPSMNIENKKWKYILNRECPSTFYTLKIDSTL